MKTLSTLLIVGLIVALAAPAMAQSTVWNDQADTEFEGGRGIAVSGLYDRVYVGGYRNSDELTDAYLRIYDLSGGFITEVIFGDASATDEIFDVATDGLYVYVVGSTAGTIPGETNLGGITDAFIRCYDLDGVLQWTDQFGTSGDDVAYGVAFDGVDGIYVCGVTNGTFAGETSAGGDDAFVRRYETTPLPGTVTWTHQFGTVSDDLARAIDAAPNGESYVVGETMGAFPAYTNQGLDDVFIREVSAVGGEVQTQQYGTTGTDRVDAVAVAIVAGQVQDLYLGGWTDGVWPDQSNAGGEDAWIKRIDGTDSEFVWDEQFGTVANDRVNGLSADASGVSVSGTVGGALPGETFLGGLYDVFVRKYDLTATEEWTYQFGTTGIEYAATIDIEYGDIFVGGETGGSFPGETGSFEDLFVARVAVPQPALSGDFDFLEEYGGSVPGDQAIDIAVGSGRSFSVGRVRGSLPGEEAVVEGDSDAFIIARDSAGNLLWQDQFGTANSDIATGVSVGGTTVYVTGFTDGTFAGETSAGAIDVFVRAYDVTGVLLWTVQFGDVGNDFGFDIVASSGGDAVVAGVTDGDLTGSGNFGGTDGFIRKVTGAAGAEVYTRQFGTAGNETEVTISGDGGSWLHTGGTTDGAFSGFTNLGGEDAFIQGWDDVTGNFVWRDQFGSIGSDHCLDTFTGPNGVVIGGYSDGVLPGLSSQGGEDGYVRMYDYGGAAPLWTKGVGSIGDDRVLAVANDTGEIMAGGYVGASVNGVPFVGGEKDGFLKYITVSDGSQLNYYPIATTGDDIIRGLDRTAGEFFIAGETSGVFPGETNAGEFDLIHGLIFPQIGVPPVSPGDELWLDQWGALGNDEANDVATDGTNVYVVGSDGFTGVAASGPDAAAGVFSDDVRIRIYDQDGLPLSNFSFGGSNLGDDDFGEGIAVDATGYYVVGWTATALPGEISNDGDDAFIRKYGFDDLPIWTVQFGGGGDDHALDVAVSGTRVIVVGWTNAGLPDMTTGGNTEAFAVAFDAANGTQMWTSQFTGGGSAFLTEAFGITADEETPRAFIVGHTDGEFPGESQLGEGGFDCYIRAVDKTNGNPLWTRQFGSNDNDTAWDVAHDNNFVYVVGEVNDAIDSETWLGAEDAFVRAYNHAGFVSWTAQFGTASTDQALAVAVGDDGLFVGGGTLDALPGQVYNDGVDAFVRKYTLSGGEVWTTQFGTGQTEQVNGLASGSVFAVGATNGTLPGESNSGGNDFFIASFEPGSGEIPNLAINAFAGPLSASIGEDITGSVNLIKENTSDFDIDAAYNIDLYLSTDAFLDEGDIILESILEAGPLANTTSNAVFANILIPPGAPTGSAFLIAYLDTDDDVDETNESDNELATAITVNDPGPGDPLWYSQIGTAGSDEVSGVASDGVSVYVVGRTDGTLPGQINAGGTDAFIRQLDTDGNELATHQFGTSGFDELVGVVVDATGVYVVGRTDGTLPGESTQGSEDYFVQKYGLTISSTPLWTMQYGGGGDDIPRAIVVDATGVYAAGTTNQNIAGHVTLSGNPDYFLIKHDLSTGDTVWIEQFGTVGSEQVGGLDADGTYIYLAGNTDGAFPSETNQGCTDGFITRYLQNGAQSGLHQVGTANCEGPFRVTEFGGDVYLAGSTDGVWPGETAISLDDAFVMYFDASDGLINWVTQFGTTALDQVWSIAADASGIYVSGVTEGTLPGETQVGTRDGFVCKYNAVGNEVWTTQFGGGANTQVIGSGTGSFYAGGSESGSLPGQSNQGGTDGFVGSFEPGAPVADVDLGVALLTGPASSALGANVSAEVVVAVVNNGSEEILSPFDVGLYLSADATITTGDDQLTNGLISIPNIAASDTIFVPIPGGLEMPATGPGGSVFLGAIVDPSDVIAETNEANNVNFTAVTIDGDSDNDGVPDSIDLCPAEDASFFDSDGDGCLDAFRGARHVEYWNVGDFPLAYSIHQDGAPGIGDGSDFTAIQNGIDKWTTLFSVTATTNYLGATTQADAQAMDLNNTVTFSDPDYVFPTGVIAVGLSTSFTVPTTLGLNTYRPGQIFDADMIFNSSMSYQTPTAGSGVDIEGVATHEGGHMFGIAHSAIATSTMFYVLPPGAATLEEDDERIFTKAYPGPGQATASFLSGSVINGQTLQPVPGAIVFAIHATSGDTLGCDYTLVDGSYMFSGLPNASYYVAIHPLDGSSTIGFIQPGNINQYVLDNAETLFIPEYYDAAESSTDDPTAKTSLSVIDQIDGSPVTGIDIITNIDDVPPTVTSVTPDSNVVDAPAEGVVVITFSEGIDINSVSGNFSVRDSISNTFVPGTGAVINDDSTLTFISSAGLDFLTTYKVSLGTGLTDKFGNGLAAPFVYFFRTGPQPPVFVSAIAPNKGVVGAIVTISGAGFEPVTTNNAVDFNGALAMVLSATPTTLVVEVPAAATSGNVIVTNALNGLMSPPVGFTVLPATEVASGVELGVADLGALPRKVAVTPDDALAFVATDAGFAYVDVDPSSADFLTPTSFTIVGGLNDIVVTPDGNRAYAISRTNERLYRINADLGSGPIATENEIVVNGEPRGITLNPAGDRAYVTTTGGEIQIFDTRLGSPTFDQQIGVILSPNPNFEGPLAFDPLGSRLVAVAGNSKALVFDMLGDSLLVEISLAGTDPKDVVIDPLGQRAYVSDATGRVSIVSLPLLSFIQEVVTGGQLRGLDITPGGSFVYATNRELNNLDAIDLREGQPTFRSVVANIPVRVNPIDVKLTSDGVLALSLSEAEQRLVVTALGTGPVINTLSVYAAPEGALLLVSGEGFDVDSLTQVSFNGTLVVPTFETPNKLELNVPVGATTGPITVISTNPTGPVLTSNPVFFEVLTPPTGGGLRLATKAQPAGAPELMDAMAVSPKGDVAVIGGEVGEIHILDTRESSPTFNSFIGSPVVHGVTDNIHDIAIGPDGQRALVLSESSTDIEVIDVNPDSPDFATNVGTIDIDLGSGHRPLAVAINPSGFTAAITDSTGGGMVHFIDMRPSSPTLYQILVSTPLADIGAGLRGLPWELAYDPSGRALFVAMVDANQSVSRLEILESNIENGSFGVVEANHDLPAGTPDEQPLALSFTPDGDRLFVLTSQVAGVPNRTVVVVNTSFLFSTITDHVQSIGNTSSPIDEFVHVSPAGGELVISQRDTGFLHMDTGIPLSLLDTSFDFLNLSLVDFEYSYDGARMLATSAFRDSVFMYDFTAATTIAKISGDGATGVVGQPLTNPLRVQVTEMGSGNPVQNIPVTYTINSGGGSFQTSNPAVAPTTVTVPTDATGHAEVTLILGAVVGTNSQDVIVTSEGLGGSPTMFTASTVDDPSTLPLSLNAIVPATGGSDVNVTTAIQTTFSRDVDPSSVTSSTFFLHSASSLIPISVVYGFTEGNTKVSLTPSAPLDPATSYVVDVTAGVLDASGGPLTNPTSSTFATAAPAVLRLSSITPVAGTVNIPAVLAGEGFDPVGSTVFFGADVASIVSAGEDFINVIVPPFATTGDVYVVANGSTSNTLPFSVLVPSISPIDDVIATVNTGTKSPRSLAITPDGAYVYTVAPDADEVIVLDVDSLVVLPGVPVGDEPIAIAAHPNGDRIYVANYGSGTVSVIDSDPTSGTFNTVIATIPVGVFPLDILPAPDGDRVIVANSGSSSLSIIDSDELSSTFNAVLATVNRGSATTTSLAITPDGARIYVGTDSGYDIVEATGYTVVKSVNKGTSTKSLKITPDGALLVALSSTGEVDIHDIQLGSPTEDQVVKSVNKGTSTKSLVISPDGALLYLVEEESDLIIVVSLAVLNPVNVSRPDEDDQGRGFDIPMDLVLADEPDPIFIDTLMAGEDPANVVFDPTGNGRTFITNAGDNTITILSIPGDFGVVTAEIRVTPRTLNLKSNGRYVSGEVILPPEFDPNDIDVSTVFLRPIGVNDSIPAEPDKVTIEDSDSNGVYEANFKFDRCIFQMIMPQGEFVPVEIYGFAANRFFRGEDEIRTLRPDVTHPKGGETFHWGEDITITWETPQGLQVDAVDVIYTKDDGENWFTVATQVPNSGAVAWTTPDDDFFEGRVMVTFFRNGEDIGSGMSHDLFNVSSPLAVTLGGFRSSTDERAAMLEWTTVVEEGLQGFHIMRSERRDGIYDRMTTEMIPSQGDRGGSDYAYRDESVTPNTTYYYKLESYSDDERQVFGPYELRYRAQFALQQNAPNPFNPTTTIRFTIPEPAQVRLVIYDVAGRQVRTLINDKLVADHYEQVWDGKDHNGRTVASGVYFYQLRAGKHEKTRKMLMLK